MRPLVLKEPSAAAPVETCSDPEARVRELHRIMQIITLRMRADGVDLPSRLGLQNRELSLLARLALAGPKSVKELVADLGIPPSTMTSLVDRMVASGFVRRLSSPEDRRLVLLETTPAATTAIEQSTTGFAAVATRMLDPLSASEQQTLLALLRRICEAF